MKQNAVLTGKGEKINQEQADLTMSLEMLWENGWKKKKGDGNLQHVHSGGLIKTDAIQMHKTNKCCGKELQLFIQIIHWTSRRI